MRLHLLTSGLALERFAPEIAARFDEVTVSLDGHSAALYRTIRGVNGLDALAAGVRALRRLAPTLPLRARSTISRHNFRHLAELADAARAMGLDQISFLAADVTSDAFNRPPGAVPLAVAEDGRLLLDGPEVAELEAVIERFVRSHARAFAAREILPGPEGLRRLSRYFRAHLGQGPFPAVDCNAPWASVFIEADGAVRPCFFHPSVGNLRERPLAELLEAAMPRFRRGLDVATDPICERCVCTLKTRLGSKLW
jgi:MoaA/NifB/PqqE/SkfB family radical SAM enzyme